MNKKDKISEIEDIKKIAPTLSSIEKSGHFSVPENYFENFSVKLKDKIDKEKEVSFFEKIVSYKTILPTAAFATLLLIFGLLKLSNNDNINSKELTAEEIQQVLEYQGLYTLDDETLAEVLYTSEIENSEEDLFEEEIIDYLIEENVNESEIYYEF